MVMAAGAQRSQFGSSAFQPGGKPIQAGASPPEQAQQQMSKGAKSSGISGNAFGQQKPTQQPGMAVSQQQPQAPTDAFGQGFQQGYANPTQGGGFLQQAMQSPQGAGANNAGAQSPMNQANQATPFGGGQQSSPAQGPGTLPQGNISAQQFNQYVPGQGGMTASFGAGTQDSFVGGPAPKGDPFQGFQVGPNGEIPEGAYAALGLNPPTVPGQPGTPMQQTIEQGMANPNAAPGWLAQDHPDNPVNQPQNTGPENMPGAPGQPVQQPGMPQQPQPGQNPTDPNHPQYAQPATNQTGSGMMDFAGIENYTPIDLGNGVQAMQYGGSGQGAPGSGADMYDTGISHSIDGGQTWLEGAPPGYEWGGAGGGQQQQPQQPTSQPRTMDVQVGDMPKDPNHPAWANAPADWPRPGQPGGIATHGPDGTPIPPIQPGEPGTYGPDGTPAGFIPGMWATSSAGPAPGPAQPTPNAASTQPGGTQRTTSGGMQPQMPGSQVPGGMPAQQMSETGQVPGAPPPGIVQGDQQWMQPGQMPGQIPQGGGSPAPPTRAPTPTQPGPNAPPAPAGGGMPGQQSGGAPEYKLPDPGGGFQEVGQVYGEQPAGDNPWMQPLPPGDQTTWPTPGPWPTPTPGPWPTPPTPGPWPTPTPPTPTPGPENPFPKPPNWPEDIPWPPWDPQPTPEPGPEDPGGGGDVNIDVETGITTDPIWGEKEAADQIANMWGAYDKQQGSPVTTSGSVRGMTQEAQQLLNSQSKNTALSGLQGAQTNLMRAIAEGNANHVLNSEIARAGGANQWANLMSQWQMGDWKNQLMGQQNEMDIYALIMQMMTQMGTQTIGSL